MSEPEPARYRTLFISDVHLGTRGSRADLLLDFLRHNDADTVYLVGDIVDGWRLRHTWYWPQSHNDVVQKLLRKVRKGTKIVFLPGNHDEFARDYVGNEFGGVSVVDQAIHETADGKRFLIIHGDQFDIVVRHARFIAFLGDWAYDTALAINGVLNRFRRALGFSYWSFSAWAKFKVKKAINFIGDFEMTLSAEAEKAGVHGVICGHIHHPVIREIGSITYVNIGDFVESCTGVVEHFDGRLEILKWTEVIDDRQGRRVAQDLVAA